MSELQVSVVLSDDDVDQATVHTLGCGHPFLVVGGVFLQAAPGTDLVAHLFRLAGLVASTTEAQQ